MNAIFWVVALLLLINVSAGLVFVGRSRGGADSLLAGMLLGTTGVALVAVMAFALPLPAALDVALFMALLAAIVGVTFVLRGWPDGSNNGEGRE